MIVFCGQAILPSFSDSSDPKVSLKDTSTADVRKVCCGLLFAIVPSVRSDVVGLATGRGVQ